MSAEVSALFAPAARTQRWLDVEAALALAQADCGLIPQDAADRIVGSARLELIDADRLAAEAERTGHPLMPLITELSRVVGAEHGGWVHWGATSQNIMQTGDVLGIKQAHAIIRGRLVAVLAALAELGERTAKTVQAGRTHGQQAVPITFGFKVAAWTDAMLRHLQRLDELPPRLFIAMAGGATGTYAAMGAAGPAVQDNLADRLGLVSMDVPSRSIADPFAELVCVQALLAATNGVIAEEVFRLMATELGELSEAISDGDVGSSTMPQKRNPKLSQQIVTLSAQVRALVPLALEGMSHSYEVDSARNAMMDEAVQQACVLSVDALARLESLLTGLAVHADAMRANLQLTGGLISSEAVMMALAASIGRQTAHEVVHHAAGAAADTGQDFATLLAADARVSAALDREQITALLDPATHTGLSAQIARRTSERARAAIK